MPDKSLRVMNLQDGICGGVQPSLLAVVEWDGVRPRLLNESSDLATHRASLTERVEVLVPNRDSVSLNLELHLEPILTGTIDGASGGLEPSRELRQTLGTIA